MFAEHVELLPNKLFTELLEASQRDPAKFTDYASELFAKMKTGGDFHFKRIEWFNGGLFDSDAALPLEPEDIKLTLEVSRLDWSSIDPAILGTLFERGLDPDKRSQLGAHYTDREKIMLIVNPVIVEPLTREWEEAKDKIAKAIERYQTHKDQGQRTRAYNEAVSIHHAFVEKLKNFRVLDPACGSGNFLYLSLLKLKDIEHHANLDAEALGLPRMLPSVGPECVKGIEINPFAAELARVSVWIGEIQWMRKNGFGVSTQPVLKSLDTIERRDALLDDDGKEAKWPDADIIIGNPPFLGGKMLISYLGENYIKRLFEIFSPAVPRKSDLVCYWFHKAAQAVQAKQTKRVGLVSTNSIRGGANKKVLKAIRAIAQIYDVWDDEPWVLDGAAVRVSLICFAAPEQNLKISLNGHPALEVFSDLTGRTHAGGIDLAAAATINQNRYVAFMGDTKGGAFDVAGEIARFWLTLPLNPNGRPNSDVLKPWRNGMDITSRPADKWIIDYGYEMLEADAAVYEAPYEHVQQFVRPSRMQNRRQNYARFWWRHVEPRPGMLSALSAFSRCIVTPCLSKFRLFAWLPTRFCLDHQIIAIARDDETTFGILHSRFHELWSLRMGTSLEDRPRYTPTTCFETFPFPEGLTPNIPVADYASNSRAIVIAKAAQRLNELRENWLNPADLVKRVPEVAPAYPDRILPVSEEAAAILKKRTLTNLYNERPAWLVHAHRALDEAVAAAYGWPADLSDEQILERLFHLNQERAKAQALQ